MDEFIFRCRNPSAMAESYPSTRYDRRISTKENELVLGTLNFFFRDKYPTCDVSFHSFNRRTIIFFFHSTIPRIRSNDITYDVQLGRCSSNENSLKIAAIRNFVFCYFPIQLELCLFSSLDPFVATYFFLIFLSDANHFTSDCFEFLLKLISPDSK